MTLSTADRQTALDENLLGMTPENWAEFGDKPLDPGPASTAFQIKVKRVADGLAAQLAGPGRRAVAFGEVGMGSMSALWLTTAVASALTSLFRDPVHVLVAGSVDSLGGSGSISTETPEGVVLESVLWPNLDPAIGNSNGRLQALLAGERKVLVHFPDAPAWIGSAMKPEEFAGMVLLSRSSHTRRAAIESVVRQLRRKRLPLLGALLLDRTYPIPERLYRFL